MRHAGRPADLTYEFEHSLEAPRGARRALERFLDDPTDPIAEDVTLAATELVTNVIRHTGSGGLLQAWDPKPDVPLRIEVADFEQTSPQVVEHPGPSGGFGLRILSTVADAWGVTATGTGKFVWAEFDRSTRSS